MTCRDCFHWKACKDMLEAQGYKISTDFKGSADRCDTFVCATDVALKSEIAKEVIDEFANLTRKYVKDRGLYLVVFKNAIAYAESELKQKYAEAGNNEN